MADERIAGIIEMLEHVRERPAVFAGGSTVCAVGTFLSGFDMGCYALGLSLPHEMRQQVKEERGGPRSAEVWPVAQMRERGMAEAAMASEMLAIDIAAWRRMAAQGAV